MGITGLLPFLEKASSACHLRDLRGKCVAIDTYCWLHRGAFACAERLARGEPTDIHILYCLKYVQLLLSYNIKPILVFDGQHLPAKAATEAKRRENRANARKRGAELLRLGRIDEARSFLRRCVDITHEMALQLIQECRKRGVDCIVAPYEADAQLAYLNRVDIAQYVITEDSDLVLFGCNRILFKLDLTGNGRLVEASKLHLAMGCREDRYRFEKFRYMCILSGCDYLDSLPGIGLAKACKFVLKTEDPDIRRALAKIPAYLNMRQLVVTEDYKDAFLKADATFRHMVVYDPVCRRQTRLSDPDEESTPEQYCCNAGQFLDEAIAFEMAIGNLDPFSLRKLDDWHPDVAGDGEEMSANAKKMRHLSIWRTDYATLKEATKETGTKAHKSSSLTTFVKRTVLKQEENQVELECKETIADVLQGYGIQSDEPSSKRLCHITSDVSSSTTSTSKVALEYRDLEALDVMGQLDQPATPKRKRNPFAISPAKRTLGGKDSPEVLLSPTKITAANRSLLHNVSPVKRIDYSQQRSQGGEVVASGSRFGRLKTAHDKGVVADEPKVISRFFCTKASVKIQTNRLIGSPKKVGSSGADADSLVSPTAIVKELKSKRDAQTLRATAIYLSSPEARLPNRGDRTPEKRRAHTTPGSDKEGIIGQLDSGIATAEEDSNTGLSSSQKENDDFEMLDTMETNSAKQNRSSPRTVRLALFERQVKKPLAQSPNRSDAAEELAIVLDDSSNDGDDGVGKQEIADALKTEAPITTLPSAPSARTATKTLVKSPVKTKARSTCKRPGLSANKRQASKGDSGTGGMTQSRLSMFGFQKKPSMQLNNR
ncbi:exonuclease 1 [Anopheles maculipalpis]|uniref:exonuclease 1 n=1 Tax=Anopheles maculipalpis TaxID=1496333 RepID=UPI0021595094|nr:exonuclease 1 [Anopheles maculipalpis]